MNHHVKPATSPTPRLGGGWSGLAVIRTQSRGYCGRAAVPAVADDEETTVADDDQVLEAIHRLQQTVEASPSLGTVREKIDEAQSVLDRIKDNIAYVLGLPAAATGAFGFLWESSAEEAALVAQVAQLEEAVADLKAEGDLLGGGVKNWSLDPSAAPGGSVTVILVAGVLVAFVGLLFLYQARRKRRR